MLVPEKYVSYSFDSLKNGKGSDPKYWDGNDQKRWRGLLKGEDALYKALRELPQGEGVVVETFVTEYAVTNPKVLEQVRQIISKQGPRVGAERKRGLIQRTKRQPLRFEGQATRPRQGRQGHCRRIQETIQCLSGAV